jgi:uncharacterized lipoprotein YddW (UPF0748 family)
MLRCSSNGVVFAIKMNNIHPVCWDGSLSPCWDLFVFAYTYLVFGVFQCLKGYDPLAFAVEETHKRGLQIEA